MTEEMKERFKKYGYDDSLIIPDSKGHLDRLVNALFALEEEEPKEWALGITNNYYISELIQRDDKIAELEEKLVYIQNHRANGLEKAESEDRHTDNNDRQPEGKNTSFPEVLDGLQADEEKR